jgi:RHS repeat-associated protein
MVRAESITATLRYTYTVDGLRVAQDVDGAVTTFAWDWATGVPEMLSDGSARYLVGHDTLGWEDAGGWTYAVPDALGSVSPWTGTGSQAVDATAAVVAARAWSPYGVESGGAQAGLGYTGEWWDVAVGLQYLRARWYDGRSGRFTQVDAVEINPPYLYGHANPINRVDPSGYIDWPTCVVQGNMAACTVWEGDSLYSIAREVSAAGVSGSLQQLVAEILAHNTQIQSRPNFHLYVGDTLMLPATWVMEMAPPATPGPTPIATPAFPPTGQPLLPVSIILPPPSPHLYIVGPVSDTGVETPEGWLDGLRHALSGGAEPTNFMVNLVADTWGYWRGIDIVSPKVGFGLDAVTQLAKDSELDLCPAQRTCRALLAGGEGLLISAATQTLSVKASIAVFGATLPLGPSAPWLPPVALAGTYFGVYIPTTLALSYGADWANEQIFALIKLRPEDDPSWWCASRE